VTQSRTQFKALGGSSTGRLLSIAIASVLATVAAVSVAQAPPAPSNVPYALPVQLPTTVQSPSVAASAPYTPAVLSLLAQLEPSNPPTFDQLVNADNFLHDWAIPTTAPGSTCHRWIVPPAGTTPSIMPMCWDNAQGILVQGGPNVNLTTGPMTLNGLGATFDRTLGNAWGQAEGLEGRQLMVTGLFGPQVDLNRMPNWGRNLTTTGADPYLSAQLSAAQIHGIQGRNLMSQMKHFAAYNGQDQNVNSQLQDQALHELYLPPYEGGFVNAQAAAIMCSYQLWQDTYPVLAKTLSSLSNTFPLSPYASGPDAQTWLLDESHFSCEQPLILTYALRDLWGSKALVSSDAPATHSTSGILQGQDHEQPTTNGYFTATNLAVSGAPSTSDPTGSTCADASGNPVSCRSTGAIHVAGFPGPGCPVYGCTLVQAVANGTIPLSVFNRALATMLYQEERFGMLGCNQTPVASSCTNPGGIGGVTTGLVPLPTGPSTGASPTTDVGTKNGDAAVVELESEEGGVLLKNDSATLPITAADLQGGVLITGPGADFLIADPTSEAALGFPDRNSINPLLQLKAFSGNAGAFTYVPALDPVGQPVPSSALSTSNGSVNGVLNRTTGPGSPTTDASLDFTAVSTQGQLAPGSYAWTGYVYVPTTDTYSFDFQFSSALANTAVTFSFNGAAATLANPPAIYSSVASTPTNAGYTEGGLTNRRFTPPGTLTGGTFYPVTITFNNTTSGAASFRFAYSRTAGDTLDAATAAAGKKLAIVFLNDSGATTTVPNPYGSTPPSLSAVASLAANQVQLLQAVAAANPNTVVVLNTTNPVLMPWIGNVKSVLEMWFAGQEGGTSTARLLLGLANPSGHLPITFPANATDTIWAYNQTTPLYTAQSGGLGDTVGPHFERLNGNGGCSGTGCPAESTTIESEGIYTDYRFFDKQGITPLFPFGWGLSYTTFGYSNLNVANASDGGLDVSFSVSNTGNVAGMTVPQVYLGAPSIVPFGTQFAVRQLSQFARVALNPGQTTSVSLHVGLRQMQYWSPKTQQWLLATGSRTVYVGDADSTSRLPLQSTINVSQPSNLVCSDEQLSATLVAGTITVPSGHWCDLIDVSVTGDLQVAGSGVRIAGSTIGGNLVATSVSNAADPLSSQQNVVCNTIVKGNLTINSSNAASPWSIGLCGGNVISGNLAFNSNAGSSNQITGNTVGQALTCTGNAAVTASGNNAGSFSGQCLH
jgi:beta-glucosidase